MLFHSEYLKVEAIQHGASVYRTPGWSGNVATLEEVREKEVHSSQARVKVVGLNGEG